VSRWTKKDGSHYLRREFYRTPRNGLVRILGEWFEPAREPLPERLWGTQRLLRDTAAATAQYEARVTKPLRDKIAKLEYILDDRRAMKAAAIRAGEPTDG